MAEREPFELGLGWIRRLYETLEKVDSFKGVIEFCKEWLLPFALPALTAISGYLQREPVMWIITASSLCFTAVTMAWVAIMVINEKKTPQNKLTFQVVFHVDLNQATAPFVGNRHQRRGQTALVEVRTLGTSQIDPDVKRTVEVGQLGVEITNNATFPISCILARAETDLEGLRPPRSTFPKDRVTVHALSKIRLLDDRIVMGSVPSQTLNGNIDLLVKYGMKGKEKFEYAAHGPVQIVMTDAGLVSIVMHSLTSPPTESRASP